MRKAGAVGPAVGDARTTTSRRRKGCSSTIARSPRARRCRSSSTTCRAAPACNIEPATLVAPGRDPRTSSASRKPPGNITQMCEICRAVPADFIVLVGRRCGDAAADGGRRARRHFGGVERNSGRDGRRWSRRPSAATSRQRATIHSRIMPLMQINFVESNPVPVKAAMAAMGLLEEVYRLPMCSPRPESREKILKVLEELDLVRHLAVQSRLEPARQVVRSRAARCSKPTSSTRRRRRVGRSRRARANVRAAARGAVVRHRPRRGTRSASADRLARQHLGEAGHPARLQVRRHRRRLDGPRPLAVLRQGHAAAQAARLVAPACASCPADPRFATAPISRPA